MEAADHPYGWLRSHAERRPDATALRVWRDGAPGPAFTWAGLLDLADRMLGGLADAGVGVGDRVVLALPSDETFAGTLLACSGLGAIAVPAPAPSGRRGDAFAERVGRMLADCRPTVVVTAAAGVPLVAPLLERVPVGAVHTAEALATAAPRSGRARPPDIAFLQYTSGSTTAPRGVLVTHRALGASCAQAAVAYRERDTDVAVTWVPLHHDMGLVTGLLRPLRAGYPAVLMTPEEFAAVPIAWLRALCACGGTLSSAPNFAYDLCVRKVTAEQAARLDLRAWRVARNAGEVVSKQTMTRFARHFACAGFSADALAPSYGMAEATLTVTTAGPGTPPLDLRVRAGSLRPGDTVEPADDGEPARWVTSSGIPLEGTRVRIEHASGDGQVGEILVAGPQVSPGYWDATRGWREQAWAPRAWHRPGDLGFLWDGHVFVLGRTDDTLILRGRAFYAADVVAVCRQFPELRPGRVVAYTDDEGAGSVRLLAEVSAAVALDPLAARVTRALANRLGLFVSAVSFLPAGALPVTTSGKVRVSESARRHQAGLLPVIAVRPATPPAGSPGSAPG